MREIRMYSTVLYSTRRDGIGYGTASSKCFKYILEPR